MSGNNGKNADTRDYILSDRMEASIKRLAILKDQVDLLSKIALKPSIWGNYNGTRCEGRRCSRPIEFGDIYWTDGVGNQGTRLCEICGNCLKYARKNALKRGEQIDRIVGGV